MIPSAFFICLACFPSNSGESPRFRFAGETMGTTWHVTVVGEAAQDVEFAVQSELDRVDSLMSTWKPDSEISRFNRLESTEWFDVSPETLEVVRSSVRISQATEGAFDVTVAPLIELWHFGSAGQPVEPPAADEIERAMKTVGWQNLELRSDPPAIRTRVPGLTINLSAIAKGYAVDRVAAALRARGLPDHLVEVGGEIRAGGRNAAGQPWKVGIEEPIVHARRVGSVVLLRDQALATSGDYRNFFFHDGKKYSHTIDPRTGWPVQHALASVSVLAESCMLADGWATALMVVGPDVAGRLASQQDLAVLFITRDSDGFRKTSLGAFVVQPAESAASAEESMPWPTFLAALVVFVLALVAMAVGVIISNKRLKGSCGGLAGMTDGEGKTACDLCAIPSAECRGERAESDSAAVSGAEES